MTEQAREVQGGGTWGPREAAAEWRRGAAARLQAFGPATEMMLDLVKVAEGSRVLDVGAGAGDSALVAAQRVGARGRVLATDVSASMLEVAAESARQAGLNNVDTRVVDAQCLDLDSDSFDAAISRNCLMLIPDYQRALTSIRRVLKPGGRFAAIVFSTPDRCPYLSLPHAIVFRIGRFTSPAPERFGEFRLAAPGNLEDAYGTAGFREISVHTVPTRRRFPSLGEAMQYARGPLPLRELMASLTRAEQEQAWAEIERALAQFVDPQGYDSPCELLIGVGTKQPLHNASIRPAWIIVGQGGTPVAHTPHWSTWDKGEPNPHATSAGTLLVDNCVPNCAQGKTSYYKVIVTLSVVKTHNGVRYYSKMTWYTPGYRLPGYKTSTATLHFSVLPGASVPYWH